MVIMLLSIWAVVVWQLDSALGVAVVGAIPKGLPTLKLAWPGLDFAVHGRRVAALYRVEHLFLLDVALQCTEVAPRGSRIAPQGRNWGRTAQIEGHADQQGNEKSNAHCGQHIRRPMNAEYETG